MRDKVEKCINEISDSRVHGTFGIQGEMADAILAIFQERLDEIKLEARNANQCSGLIYEEKVEYGSKVYMFNKTISEKTCNIINLCTLTTEPTTPTLQVGQIWEKAPTHLIKIKFMHTSDEGVEQIVVENKGGHLVVMKPDTFDSYQLVKETTE